MHSGAVMMGMLIKQHVQAVALTFCDDVDAAEVELLGKTVVGRQFVDVDALARLEDLGFGRALAAQALLQVLYDHHHGSLAVQSPCTCSQHCDCMSSLSTRCQPLKPRAGCPAVQACLPVAYSETLKAVCSEASL